jgi:hypothetical protein
MPTCAGVNGGIPQIRAPLETTEQETPHHRLQLGKRHPVVLPLMVASSLASVAGPPSHPHRGPLHPIMAQEIHRQETITVTRKHHH